jgi:hypothetical protein
MRDSPLFFGISLSAVGAPANAPRSTAATLCFVCLLVYLSEFFVMRRQSTGRKKIGEPFAFISDFGAERLQTFASILLTWNAIESAVDLMLGFALRINPELFVSVSSRINGFDGKVAIIKHALTSLETDEIARLPIAKALNAAEHYKKFRDAVAHVKVTDAAAEISDTVAKRGLVYEVLITKDALDALYLRICILTNEVIAAGNILGNAAVADITDDDSKREQHVELVRLALARLHEAQASRESLGPLPEFPVEPQAPPTSEGDPRHPD